ncbi:MAG: ATPase, T2SS/T4P/T4SS family, partial [Patescibacteria group bacterium]
MTINKEKIEELRKQEAEDLAKIFSQKYQLPYLDLTRITIDLDSLKIVPEKTARDSQLAVFQSVGKKLQVAARNPNIPSTQETLEELKRTGYFVQLFIVSENSLQKAWSRYKEVPEFTEISKGLIEISQEKIEDFLAKIKNTENLKTSLETLAGSNQARKISEMLEAILGGALSLEASDVHIEPQEETARLRTRLDGVLQDIVFFDKKTYSLILSRIKLISELKLNIHDKAQDGRFTIRAQ